MDQRSHAPRNGPTAEKKIRDLLMKAQEYLLALEAETGIGISPEIMRPLQLALLEDFIEVHNAALGSDLRLPENKASVDALIA